MKITMFAVLLILVMMSGMAVAEDDQMYGVMNTCTDCVDVFNYTTSLTYMQADVSSTEVDVLEVGAIAATMIEKNWLYGRRNFAPGGIEYAYWDFEEGRNCEIPFKNQYPEVATFHDVPATRLSPFGYGPDHPSYVRAGGSMCGSKSCYMNIYPLDNSRDWIYVVNENAAFSPVTCCVSEGCWAGECIPGRNARIELKKGTTYISFLASTGTNINIRLYDRRGRWMYSGTIDRTIDRVDSEPSNFTRFFIYSPDREIGLMTLSGTVNDWHVDDLIIGGSPGYLPNKLDQPVNYTYVADLAEQLHGVWWCEHALGFDYEDFTYAEPSQFKEYLEFWNPETKQFENDQGISNPGLIFWAYNKDSQDLAGIAFVKQITPAKMMKHDFKVSVDSADTQPGDVYFMDYFNTRDGVDGQDGTADFVGMVVSETDGMDTIASRPWLAGDPIGVIYSKKSIVERSPAFMGYKRLPGVIRGGKNPIPKGH